MPSNHLILCHPLLLPPSVFPSIKVFSNESVLHIKWPKYWTFSFSIRPPNEYTGLISFRTDWFDQPKGLSRVFSKTTVQKHQFFGTHPFLLFNSYPYVTIGKTISLTKQTFVSRVMSLLFNIPSRFVITFSSKEQASFNFMAAVTICTDLGSEENTVSHCFHCFPIYLS